MGYRILLVGSGGREHALAWKILQSPLCDALIVAPGNPGIVALLASDPGRGSCVAVGPDSNEALVALAQKERVDLVVCGPEVPLAAGLGDAITAAGLPFFGPSARAAEIEGSKAFAKDLMSRAGVPTAAFGTFSTVAEAEAFIDAQQGNVVVKADGLCAGKGVTVTDSHAEAKAAVREMLDGHAFGAASARVVIEERLTGRECSLFAIVDGERFVLMASAEDHKTIFDGDKGPNTGGMGAYSPSPLMTDALLAEVSRTVFAPTIAAMAAAGRPFRGLLYGGLMLTPDRGPMVIEWNCRFGDPETQAILPRLDEDLVPWLMGAAKGALPGSTLRWKPGVSVCVVLAAAGYPGKVRSGDVITGLGSDGGVAAPDVLVFHAGTSRAGSQFVTAGGRVLGVSSAAASLEQARARAYAVIKTVQFPGMQLRTDIGVRGN